jgi:cysteinyl-tRNA synthetase
VYDVLRRYLEWTGLEVELVSNVTDIDDKIIDRAEREHTSSEAVAQRWEQAWWEAMDALGVRRPDVDPHATDYVEQMVDLVAALLERGAAYATEDGVYLSVESVEGYGLLSRQALEDLRAGGGERAVLGAEHKRHPADFALWKLAKEGEPAWPAPFGAGRPGWHTECVAMSLELLGEGFDLHTGGEDLKFPHHENERAQAVALGKRFASHWMHHGFVVDTSGEKMSKSLGNFTDLVELIATVDPRAYRMLVLQAHYRSPLRVDRETIGAAERSLAGLDALARRVAPLGVEDAVADDDLLGRFAARMDDDLDTPGALAVVFDGVRRANGLLDRGEEPEGLAVAAAVLAACRAVGLVLHVEAGAVPPEVVALADQRDAARAARDWAVADAMRDELVARGWIVEDTPQGTRVRRA